MTNEAKAQDQIGLTRAQSSLELLSQTAAVMTEGGAVIEQISPHPYPARISPAVNNLDTKSSLHIPDMSAERPAPPFLEQKRSFLPPAVHYENGGNGVVLAQGQHQGGMAEASPNYYAPGLFLSYSNGSTGAPAPAATNDQHQPLVSMNGSDTSGGDAVGQPYLASGSFSSGGSFGGNGSQNQQAFVPPRPQASQETVYLRQQLTVRDATISALQQQVERLQQEIGQLKQLPTGKISQIPIEDMLGIMREYGSEVSDMAMPPRKTHVQQASVVRQFRRWNPNFLDWFEHVNGAWVPKLGKEGELKRRKEARHSASEQRKKKGASTKQARPDDNISRSAV